MSDQPITKVSEIIRNKVEQKLIKEDKDKSSQAQRTPAEIRRQSYLATRNNRY